MRVGVEGRLELVLSGPGEEGGGWVHWENFLDGSVWVITQKRGGGQDDQ